MKCIRCGTDSKLKDRRASGKCPACQEPFAFEPTGDRFRVTDGLFQKIIDDVSAQDTLFFTENQLWYEFNRRLGKRRMGLPPAAGALLSGIGGTVLAVITASPIIFLLGAVGAVAGIRAHIRSKREPQRPQVTFEVFEDFYLAEWIKAHGPIERLLLNPAKSEDDPLTPSRAGKLASAPPDLTAYSFDRAVVTQSRAVAAMLVANRFHFENNCAILSLDGYPGRIRDDVMQMLRRNPRLIVYSVHDASLVGCRTAWTLRGDDWFPNLNIRIVDVGLQPKDAIQMKLMVADGIKGYVPPDITGHLSREEVSWLKDGLMAELETLRPAKLMRAIYQGFAQASNDGSGGDSGSDGGGSDGGIIFLPGPSPWVYGGGSDASAPDSFG